MAAEKLTKGRIGQILVMMTLLISAFWWRTFEHNDTGSKIVSCDIGSTCHIHEMLTNVQLRVENNVLVLDGVTSGWRVTVKNALPMHSNDSSITFDLPSTEQDQLELVFMNKSQSQNIRVMIDLD
ncbi:hypothetical protein [Vibrio agarivorans]|uniref:hypothetical protein n=1 Tax=Vibrio agarivorans TaxID=153622 RepID=UPI0025B2D8C7|nr:hypothetical protein [Vibrio agarivorans]MDN3663305.1 hypothetical protein [Vibrio agarivorans]